MKTKTTMKTLKMKKQSLRNILEMLTGKQEQGQHL